MKEAPVKSCSTNSFAKSEIGKHRFFMCYDMQILNQLEEQSAIFDARFSRCQGLLYFTARRVLGGKEGIEEAVRNCWRSACRNPPKFEYEGAFRSWLIRILIDEALVILREVSCQPAVCSAGATTVRSAHTGQASVFITMSGR